MRAFIGPIPSIGVDHEDPVIVTSGELLVEAAWHHKPAYKAGTTIRARWDLAQAAAGAAMPVIGGCTAGHSSAEEEQQRRRRRDRSRNGRLVLVFGHDRIGPTRPWQRRLIG